MKTLNYLKQMSKYSTIVKRFCLLEKQGDLFTNAPTDSLAHCVSVDLRMGKGIAVAFRNTFGGLDDLKRQNVSVGGVGILNRNGRYIYYLITKVKYSHKPTYQDLESSLRSMKDHCVKNGVQNLSMPRIGCGLDGLDWQRVSKLINNVFSDSNITITVYTL